MHLMVKSLLVNEFKSRVRRDVIVAGANAESVSSSTQHRSTHPSVVSPGAQVDVIQPNMISPPSNDME